METFLLIYVEVSYDTFYTEQVKAQQLPPWAIITMNNDDSNNINSFCAIPDLAVATIPENLRDETAQRLLFCLVLRSIVTQIELSTNGHEIVSCPGR